MFSRHIKEGDPRCYYTKLTLSILAQACGQSVKLRSLYVKQRWHGDPSVERPTCSLQLISNCDRAELAENMHQDRRA